LLKEIEETKETKEIEETKEKEILGIVGFLGFIGFLGFLFSFHKLQRHRIQTISFSCGWRTIGKHMSQMCIATRTENFRPAHAVRVIIFLFHVAINRCVKTWPTGARLKLCR
jgi:hypothetical protein